MVEFGRGGRGPVLLEDHGGRGLVRVLRRHGVGVRVLVADLHGRAARRRVVRADLGLVLHLRGALRRRRGAGEVPGVARVERRVAQVGLDADRGRLALRIGEHHVGERHVAGVLRRELVGERGAGGRGDGARLLQLDRRVRRRVLRGLVRAELDMADARRTAGGVVRSDEVGVGEEVVRVAVDVRLVAALDDHRVHRDGGGPVEGAAAGPRDGDAGLRGRRVRHGVELRDRRQPEAGAIRVARDELRSDRRRVGRGRHQERREQKTATKSGVLRRGCCIRTFLPAVPGQVLPLPVPVRRRPCKYIRRGSVPRRKVIYRLPACRKLGSASKFPA